MKQHRTHKRLNKYSLLFICGSMIGNNNFSSIVLFPMHPRGIVLFIIFTHDINKTRYFYLLN